MVSTAKKSSFEPYIVYTQNYVCYRVCLFLFLDMLLIVCFLWLFRPLYCYFALPYPLIFIYLPSKPRWKCSIQICSSGKVAGLNPAICVLCAIMEVWQCLT